MSNPSQPCVHDAVIPRASCHTIAAASFCLLGRLGTPPPTAWRMRCVSAWRAHPSSSENASATEPASMLAVFVADDGAQLTSFDP
jgi:hypothetical protein